MKEKLFIADFLMIDFPELEGSPDLVYKAKQKILRLKPLDLPQNM